MRLKEFIYIDRDTRIGLAAPVGRTAKPIGERIESLNLGDHVLDVSGEIIVIAAPFLRPYVEQLLKERLKIVACFPPDLASEPE